MIMNDNINKVQDVISNKITNFRQILPKFQYYYPS